MSFHRLAVIALVFAAFTFSACGGTPTAPTPSARAAVGAPIQNPALSIVCPTSVSSSGTENGLNVAFSQPTTSGGVAPVEVTCTRQSGSTFSSGTTSVQCTARDAAGQSASCLFNVTVTVPTPRLGRTKFLAFGDSLTVGEVIVPVSETTSDGHPNFRLIVVPQAAYPTKLQTLLRSRYSAQASSIEVANGGLSGEWAQDGRDRLDRLLANTRPEVVIILEGYNDVGSQNNVELVRAASAINAMAANARARGARVILTTLPPPGPFGMRSVPTRYVTDFNARVRTIAAGEGALLVDLYADMSTDVSRYIGLDGLHPTEAGYERIAELLFRAIRGEMEVR
jgi:lysophospholipase L1-like esterase